LHYPTVFDTIRLMDDPRVLRIITVGLILAALAVVYFLFTGGFAVGKPKVSQKQVTVTPSPVAQATANPSATPSVVGQAQPTAIPSSTAIPTTAYDTLSNRSQGNVQNLPSTGFPVGLAIIFSTSAIVSGFGLRRFPK
jgi:hypothetical protein